MVKNLNPANFQTEINGKKTDLFFLENSNGIRVAITNYGARIVAVWVPDRQGEPDNVVAGYTSIDGYLNHPEIHLGAVVGRYANRIAGASFVLNGKTISLNANEGVNQLHGGKNGFHNAVWHVKQDRAYRLTMHHLSPDGKEGFQGNLKVGVTYTLTDADEFLIEYKAETDTDTVLNITNHSYFNLGGESKSIAVADHYLRLNAEEYLPVSDDLIPTGEIASVENTPLDFRKEKRIGDGLKELQQQHRREGYDHNFVLKKERAGKFTTAADLGEVKTGRKLKVKTTEPGLQLFTCAFDCSQELPMNSALCLETQHFPDSPNRPDFPSTVLRKGEEFYSKTAYSFSVIN